MNVTTLEPKISMTIAEENKTEYKKIYLHMLNRFAYKNNAISKEMFDYTEAEINKLQH